MRDVRAGERGEDAGLAAHDVVAVRALVERRAPEHVLAVVPGEPEQDVLRPARDRLDVAQRPRAQTLLVHPRGERVEIDAPRSPVEPRVVDTGELLGHLPEPPGRDLVLRPARPADDLRVPALLTEPVGSEVLTADDRRVGGGAQGRQRTHRRALEEERLDDRPAGVTDGVDDPARVLVPEVRAGPARVRGECERRCVRGEQPPLQLGDEEQVGQLALEVRLPRAVASARPGGRRRRCGRAGGPGC